MHETAFSVCASAETELLGLSGCAPDDRYEVQGEYVIPPDTRIPDSAASMAPMDLIGARSGSPPKAKAPKLAFDQATGRWRLQVIPPAHYCLLHFGLLESLHLVLTNAVLASTC